MALTLNMTSRLSYPLPTSNVSSKCLLSPKYHSHQSCRAYCCQPVSARALKDDWVTRHVSCLQKRYSSPLDPAMLSMHCSCLSHIVMVTSISEMKGKVKGKCSVWEYRLCIDSAFICVCFSTFCQHEAYFPAP